MLNFEHPYVATDMVLFRMEKSVGKRGTTDFKLMVLMVARPEDANIALPGGFIGMTESLEENVMRKLREKTGLSGNFYCEQLYTKSDIERDERGRIISCSYLGIVNQESIKGVIIKGADWYEINDLLFAQNNAPSIAFDHGEIIKYALERMAGKVMYTNLAFAFLPELFTIYDLQKVYEIILGKPIGNFRRKISPLLDSTDLFERDMARRPAQLFKRSDTPVQW